MHANACPAYSVELVLNFTEVWSILAMPGGFVPISIELDSTIATLSELSSRDEIGKIVSQVTCGMRRGGKKPADFIEAGFSGADEMLWRNYDAFLDQTHGMRRHRTGGNTTYLRMMGAVCDIADESGTIEDRRDESDIR